MKNLFLIGLCFFLLSTLSAQLWIVDPLEPIYPDKNNLTGYGKNLKLDFPIGTVADVNILVKVPRGESFSITIENNGIQSDSDFLSKLIAVPVEENTGLDSRTEQFKNKVNPHVIRRAPFHIYEVIRPVEENKFFSENTFEAFQLSIPERIFNIPGRYSFKITMKSESLQAEGKFSARIYSSSIPPLAETDFFYTNWFNLGKMEKYHQVERWSDDWFEMLNSYAGLMAHGRQNSITIPGELIKLVDDEVVLDEDKLLRFINVFREKGFQYFEAPHLMNRGKEDDWGDPELKVAQTGRRYDTENGKDDIEKLITRIQEFTVKHQLTENWLQHIADEPTAVNAECYRRAVKQVKRIFPEAIIMEATNDRDSLVGAIDLWCPLINDFQENETFFREREQAGERVLVYTCLVPGGPWLNRTLDMEKVRQVYFGWGAARYNTAGYLHWGLNQYMADPFQQSVIKHPSPIASANNYLPAGDTHVIYPGENGPLSSIRFEAHRIGCEDYDLLTQLKKRNLKKHDRLVKKVFRSYTDYEIDVEKYRKIRKKLLKSLE